MGYSGCCPADSDLEIAWRAELDEEISLVKSPLFDEFSSLIKIIANPLRIRILVLLDRKDHSVYELMYVLKEPQNLLSYNLGILKKADLIESYYRSRHKTYRISDKTGSEMMKFIRQSFCRR